MYTHLIGTLFTILTINNFVVIAAPAIPNDSIQGAEPIDHMAEEDLTHHFKEEEPIDHMAEEDLMHHFKEEDRVMSMVNNDDINEPNSIL
ncbi:hypothetical protein K502DRAFT_353484 [Neoconidiobolus thromboides FSU 785]|nr:hypothetical protein K502DRAFT_353484 [Neoconidiobolus thromboides FSU 785]